MMSTTTCDLSSNALFELPMSLWYYMQAVDHTDKVVVLWCCEELVAVVCMKACTVIILKQTIISETTLPAT